MSYCIYLRKSRADEEAEQRGEGETLSRHEKALLELASKLKLPISAIYREIVSGETISARPIMQQLLSEVEKGSWQGVLVMEVERLARGDTIDQGIVAQTFKYSNTLIVTPTKTYDPNNEFDEEYFEFGLFMSRREYKTINRRLQRGRLASVNEGKYVGNKNPYGYERVKIQGDKGYTLKIIEDEAKIVKLIFEFYTIGQQQDNGSLVQLGGTKISKYLNDRNIPTSSGKLWTVQTISGILRNPVYIGKIKWGGRPQEKRVINGEVVLSRPRKSLNNITLVDGLHEAIIDVEQWKAAQKIMSTHAMHRTPSAYVVSNPLAGIVVCKKCGTKMTRRPYKGDYPDTIICHNTNCDCASSFLYLVENAVLDSLRLHLIKLQTAEKNKTTPLVQNSSNKNALKINETELNKLHKQVGSLHDLLEQGIYDKDTFLKRNKILSDKINELGKANVILKQSIEEEQSKFKMQSTIIPRIEYVLETYPTADNAEQKNNLLKTVIEKVYYEKEPGGRWKVKPDEFLIELYVKL